MCHGRRSSRAGGVTDTRTSEEVPDRRVGVKGTEKGRDDKELLKSDGLCVEDE